MRLIILGCGSSMGVPALGCDCKVCISKDKKNNRLRSSVLIETDSVNLLIDSGPDFRQQFLRREFKPVDAVLYTHAHSDHCVGINDLRCFNIALKKVIPVYGNSHTIETLKNSFSFVFDSPNNFNWSRCYLEGNKIDDYAEFNIGDVRIQAFEQIHGKLKTSGYMIGGVAYSTDLNFLPEKSLLYLKGKVKVLIINCLRYKSSTAHNNLESALHWINEIKPDQAILTHMSHEIDYNEIHNFLPQNVIPAYDGMEINV